jgi:hypothetical protein
MGIAGEVCRGKFHREVGGSACGARAGLDNVGEGGVGCDLSLQLDRASAVFGARPQDHVAGRRITRRDTVEGDLRPSPRDRQRQKRPGDNNKADHAKTMPICYAMGCTPSTSGAAAAAPFAQELSANSYASLVSFRGAGLAREPGTHGHGLRRVERGQCSWFPGPALTGRPGMTVCIRSEPLFDYAASATAAGLDSVSL